MTKDEAVFDTLKHIFKVRGLLARLAVELTKRGEEHDQSKMEEPELEGFAKHTSQKELKPFLEHHHSQNRHHAEHFVKGVREMTLIDIMEMFCDWCAESMEKPDSNFSKDIEKKKRRYKINPQLNQIFLNTVKLVEEKYKEIGDSQDGGVSVCKKRRASRRVHK